MLRAASTWWRRVTSEPRLARLEHASTVAEHLARIGELDWIIARSEAFACALVPCDEARITLGLNRSSFDANGGWSDTLCIALPSSSGARLGWMTAARRQGPAFSADDEAVFEHLARSMTLAAQAGLQGGGAAREHKRAEMLLSRIDEGVIEFDERLQFLAINEAAGRLLRTGSPGEVVGSNLWDLAPGSGAGDFGSLCQTALDTETAIWATAWFASLHSCFELRAFPHDRGLMVVFRDVTEQRWLRNRVRRSNRLEVTGQLTSGFAHDVNNLLTVMLGNFETLAAHAEQRLAAGATDQAQEAELELALAGQRAGESAASLVRRMLAYSRGQPASIRTIDVAPVLRSLEPLIHRTVADRIKTRVNCAADLRPVAVDPSELESAVLNLVLNAKDAMPDGGVLELTAENVDLDQSGARTAGLEREGAFTTISVADSGFGMTPEVKRQAFEPFFTTKDDGKGTGLGLAMVNGFARQSGGHVQVDSEPGKGTRLCLYLPSARETASLSTRASSSDTPQQAFRTDGDEHVLLVEDNALVRAHAETMLRSLGYRVTTAGSGPEAIGLFTQGLQPDLLFTDVELSCGMTGFDLAEAAAALRPGLPLLFTSGHTGALMRNGYFRPGMALLAKPFRRTDLAVAIRSQLDLQKERLGD